MLVLQTEALLQPQREDVFAGAAAAQELAAIEAALAGVDAFRQYMQAMLPSGPMRDHFRHVQSDNDGRLVESGERA